MHHKVNRVGVLSSLTSLALIVLISGGCTGGQTSGTISEAGSTTIQPVAEKLAAAFIEKHPDIDITVQGGSSSTGIKSVANGIVDIGAASRDLRSSEPDLVTHLLARDGIAIIVHPDNSIDRLTNWNEVGGNGAL